MALTESSMINLGVIAPDFELLDTVSGDTLSLEQLKGEKATVIMFICNHCPYVIHVNPEINRIYDDYINKGVSFIGISSNDEISYPQDGPVEMTKHAKAAGYKFPYLFDKTQEVAKAYDAACTPDFYVFDKNMKLAYRGRIDESRPRVSNPEPLSGKDIRGALNAILAEQMVSEIQYPSMGCNIKWKSNY
jgi:peroxiredoxin